MSAVVEPTAQTTQLPMPPTAPQKGHDQKRIAVLDGFRALAILLVIGYHYFTRWAPPLAAVTIYPYGGGMAQFWPFQYGYLGVNLFFIISGFVISMTLFRSSSLLDFAWKRFSRLFPTMLLCSIITFILVRLLPQAGFTSHLRDFAPSLTFTDPQIWTRFLGGHFARMDGVYWSLSVEVKFYFWIGILFFLCPPRRFFTASAVAFPLLWGLHRGLMGVAAGFADSLGSHFALEYLPWFIAGIGFYALFTDHRSRWGWLLVGEALAAQAAAQWVGLVSMLLFDALFWAALYRPRWIAWCAARPLAAIGAASYSLYLLHQHIGLSLIAAIGTQLPTSWLPWSWWLAPGVATLMIGVSLVIYRYWEMPAKSLLTRWWRPPRRCPAQ